MKKLNYFCALVYLLIGTSMSAQYTKLLDFEDISTGNLPVGALTSDGNFLYGMTPSAGINGLGTIFKIMPDGTGFEKLLDFAGATNGSIPRGSLFFDGTFLYGMTSQGGINTFGTIFKILPDGTGYVQLLDFDDSMNGRAPEGDLIYDGTFLYGTTFMGGINERGTIFKIMPDGSGYVKLLDFEGEANGSNPRGSLILDGEFLYGVTYGGGTNAWGTIFKIMPNGTGYVKLKDFTGTANGNFPHGSLISVGNFLYGMTEEGGANGYGALFKIMSDGTGYSNLLNFDGATNGNFPLGSLIYDGTFLYGMNQYGGTTDFGTLFKILPDGTGYEKLLDFAGTTNGRFPRGSLFSDGMSIYGMTAEGGTNNLGTVFKYGLTLGIDGLSMSSDGLAVYPNPTSNHFTIGINGEIKNSRIDIYDLNGQKVRSTALSKNQESITLTRDHLASGVYFISLTEDAKVIAAKKLIIID